MTLVNAVSQSKILLDILDTLDEENLSFVKRVKNSKISSYPKTCSPREYRNATAFEALIAKWYIEKKDEKIREILEKYVLKKEEKL
jgi:ribonuclease-3 family protein